MQFSKKIKSACWEPMTDIDRSFVKHQDNTRSPGQIWRLRFKNSEITLSVLIPTLDANRNGYFLKLLSQIEKQNFKNFEVIIVKGDPRQGRAINIAAASAKGQYLLTLDDDTSLPDNKTFKKLVGVMKKYPQIGIAGGNNIIPKDSTSFVKKVMKQIPRRSWKEVKKITESDLAEHPCMIMRKEDFKKAGGENEFIYRGLDPYIREEFRKLNKTVVVVPKVIYTHLPPDSALKLYRQFFRNGKQAYITNKNYPQWVIETPNYHGKFIKQKAKLKRRIRFFLILIKSILTMKFILFFSEVSYATGYIWGIIENQKSITIKN